MHIDVNNITSVLYIESDTIYSIHVHVIQNFMTRVQVRLALRYFLALIFKTLYYMAVSPPEHHLFSSLCLSVDTNITL